MLVGWAALLALMSPTAFRIDEPNIIAIARQIARHPLDPYGFAINWNGVTGPAWSVLANPPLVPAWLAAWASIFGWSEVSLHIAVIPFSLIALLAVAMFTDVPALILLSPAFVLGSQVVMPDVAMLAAVTLAVAAAMRDTRAMLAIACVAGFAAPLMKYNGVVAVVPLAVLAIQRRTLRHVAIAAMPVVSLVIWSIIGWQLYGSPHLFALQKLQSGGLNPLPGIIAAFGLGVLPLCAWRFDVPSAIVGIGSAAMGVYLLEYPIASAVLYGIACAAAAAFVIRIRSRDAVLISWLVAPFLFQFGQAFTSVRYLIAMLPPAVLLARAGSARIRTAIAAVLVVTLSFADAETANLYRSFAASHRTDRYSGHWGLQHYAEARGEKPLESGDRITSSTTIAMHAFPQVVAPGRRFPMTIPIPLRTIDCAAAANFYGNAIANCSHYPVYLPFGFSRQEVETFVIAEPHP